MLAATTKLSQLLEAWRGDANATPYRTEFYTWTLASGSVIRWTAADRDLTWNGNTYARGPGIKHSAVTRQVGTASSQIDVTLYMDAGVTVNGVPLASFIANGGFFNALLQFEVAYAADPGSAIVGTLAKFTGRVRQFKDSGESQATLVVMNWMSLLNVQVPVDVWQPPCSHTVFDSGCTLDRASFAVNGIARSGSTSLVLVTNLHKTAGYFDLGSIVFTTGANTGQGRTVKSHTSNGTLSLVRPLPSNPSPGDLFTAYPGCDLTTATCRDKFNNLLHRKGYEFVPLNEMAAP